MKRDPRLARGSGNWHPGCSRLAPRTGEIPNPGTHTSTNIPGCDGLAPGVHRLLITARMRKSRLGDLSIRSRQLQTGGGEGRQARDLRKGATKPQQGGQRRSPRPRPSGSKKRRRPAIGCVLRASGSKVSGGVGVPGFCVWGSRFRVCPRNPNSKPRSRNPEP